MTLWSFATGSSVSPGVSALRLSYTESSRTLEVGGIRILVYGPSCHLGSSGATRANRTLTSPSLTPFGVSHVHVGRSRPSPPSGGALGRPALPARAAGRPRLGLGFCRLRRRSWAASLFLLALLDDLTSASLPRARALGQPAPAAARLSDSAAASPPALRLAPLEDLTELLGASQQTLSAYSRS